MPAYFLASFKPLNQATTSIVDNDDEVDGGTTTINPSGSGSSASATGGETQEAISVGVQGASAYTGTTNAGGSGANGAVIPGGVGTYYGPAHIGGRAAIGADSYGAGARGATCAPTSSPLTVNGESGTAGCCIVIAH